MGGDTGDTDRNEPAGRVVVIGVGNEFRHDDGAGPQVVAQLRSRARPGVELLVSDGDPARLIEAWDGAALAVVADTVRAEPAVPGRLHRLVLDRDHLVLDPAVSSHGMGLGEAIGLAAALGRLPERLIVHTVEVGDVSVGTGLTPPVAAAIDVLADAMLRDLDLSQTG
jgi:hydrogenase maturation protease